MGKSREIVLYLKINGCVLLLAGVVLDTKGRALCFLFCVREKQVYFRLRTWSMTSNMWDQRDRCYLILNPKEIGLPNQSSRTQQFQKSKLNFCTNKANVEELNPSPFHWLIKLKGHFGSESPFLSKNIYKFCFRNILGWRKSVVIRGVTSVS